MGIAKMNRTPLWREATSRRLYHPVILVKKYTDPRESLAATHGSTYETMTRTAKLMCTQKLQPTFQVSGAQLHAASPALQL